ncbi:unnamed protein product, partial [Ascophyllum nodosum]
PEKVLTVHAPHSRLPVSRSNVLKHAMNFTALRTVLILWTISSVNAFTGVVLHARTAASRTPDRSMFMSPPSSVSKSRRAVVREAGAVLGGVIGSTFLPTGTLAATKTQRKVFTTDGGVKFIVLKEGEGPLARDGDFCVVEFTGFLPDGSVFDASNSPGRKPVAFKLGAGGVIKGWEEVLRAMNQAGAQVQMVVPANLAFGDKGICIENGECLIKPGMDVRYDLKLQRIAPAF